MGVGRKFKFINRFRGNRDPLGFARIALTKKNVADMGLGQWMNE